MEEQLTGQMSLFDCFGTDYKITKPIRLIELFAGIGSQAMSLRDIGAKFEHWKVVEFDKYAIASYNAIHGTDFPVMDITKVHGEDLEIKDKLDYTYLMTYSFPCTDLSVAGKMLGMAEGSGTRSSLLWEVRRLLKECGDNLPQVLMMENVPQVHSKSNMPHFQKWLDYLTSKGYSNFWQDLNAKNYGVAQSRNRCFVISILGDYKYEFPKPFPLEKRMKDYLEESVDEKFYVTSDKARDLIDKLIKGGKLEISQTNQDVKELKLGNIYGEDKGTGFAGNVWDQKGISPTLTTMQGGGREPHIVEVNKLGFIDKGTGEHQSNMIFSPKGASPTVTTIHGGTQQIKVVEVKQIEEPIIVALDEQNKNFRFDSFGTLTTDGSSPKHNNREVEIKQATKEGYIPCEVGGVCDLNYPDSTTRRGRVQGNGQICPTLTTENTPSVLEPWIWEIDGETYLIRIRKLTPRECWRLMSFTDEDFDKAQSVNSNTQLYKQAGNSICKLVMCHIFKNLIGEQI